MGERVSFYNKSSRPLTEVMRTVYDAVLRATNLDVPFKVDTWEGGCCHSLLVR